MFLMFIILAVDKDVVKIYLHKLIYVRPAEAIRERLKRRRCICQFER